MQVKIQTLYLIQQKMETWLEEYKKNMAEVMDEDSDLCGNIWQI